MDPKRTYKSNTMKQLDSKAIKFYVSKSGYLTEIENLEEIGREKERPWKDLRLSMEYSIQKRNEEQEVKLFQIKKKIEKDVKRTWNCMVAKWIGLKKDNQINVVDAYQDPAFNQTIYELEMTQDENPFAIKEAINEKLRNEEFFKFSIYDTVRKQPGKGIWIQDYKKQYEDEQVFGERESQMELLKKEFQLYWKLGQKISKNYSNYKQEETVFHITNISDYYNANVLEDMLMPIKTIRKNQDLFVYSHRNMDYVTVEVECDNRIMYLIMPESELEVQRRQLIYEDMRTFIKKSKDDLWKVRELLQQNQVPFQD